MVVVLVFSDVGERIIVYVLVLGILVSWLLLFVLFFILDWNFMLVDWGRKLMF